jgi:hypothetical protein
MGPKIRVKVSISQSNMDYKKQKYDGIVTFTFFKNKKFLYWKIFIASYYKILHLMVVYFSISILTLL